MCTSPILIRNKKFRSISVHHPNEFIKVPCGCCDECLRKRAKDLYIRARFEAERCFKNGGCGFMCCLTYADSLVPYLIYNGKKYMVFNKKDVIKFIKRLRTHLDRFFKSHYGINAPDFKYIVTSEYGTDPTRSHRPHYHLIFLFDKYISYFVFHNAFVKSLTNSKTGKRYFGIIYQCAPLDIKKGGIKYSTKYILKDISFSGQDKIIRQLINYNRDVIENEFSIISCPQTEDDFFFNRCVRSSKNYRKAVETRIRCYSNMLQFYLCSNDFGCTAIIEHYGENLFSLGVLNIDTFPYSIPKAVVQKIERVAGTERKDELVKSVFMSRFDQILEVSKYNNYIDNAKAALYRLFVDRFIISKYGCLYLVSPSGLSVSRRLFDLSRIDDVLLDEFNFYDDKLLARQISTRHTLEEIYQTNKPWFQN